MHQSEQTALRSKVRLFDQRKLLEEIKVLLAELNKSKSTPRERRELFSRIFNGFITVNYQATGKRFSKIRSFFYRQLYKYLLRQISFNEDVGKAIKLHEDDINSLHRQIGSADLISKFSNLLDTEFDQVLKDSTPEARGEVAQAHLRINALYALIKHFMLNESLGKKNINIGNKIFYSQFGEDNWIANNVDLPKKGFFIDVGAADGVVNSNTYYFEKCGWDGICFEPNPENFQLAKVTRNKVEPLAISSKSGKTFFELSDESPDWSKLSSEKNSSKLRRITVNTIRLDEYITNNSINHIDLLSIDTEGSEIDVLHSLDLERHKPTLIIVEFLNVTDKSEEIKLLFRSYPYKLVCSTRANLIFKLDEKKI